MNWWLAFESASLELPQKKIGCFSPQPSLAIFSLCHLQKEISGKILIQYKMGVSPEQWSVLIWTSWGSGSCFSEITLRLLLLQLHFGVIFVLVLFRQGSGTAQRNWGVMELHWNKLKIIFKLWSRGIQTNPWINGLPPERQEREQGQPQWVSPVVYILFVSPHDQYFSFSLNSGINRSDFTQTSGNICSYRKCESKRPGQRSKRKCGSKGQQAALGKEHPWKLLLHVPASPSLQNIRSPFEVTVAPVTGCNFLNPLSSSS